jgi:outer membrane protein TolC
LTPLALAGLIAAVLGGPARAQPAPPATVLERLVDEGLQSNLALRQEEVDLARSRRALAEARGRLAPTLQARARYSRAEGGRTIDIPVGDLVNPVYRTLNDLLADQGTPPAFAPVDNQSIPFLREREQETTLRLEQPLFAPRLLYGVRAGRHRVDARKAQVDAFQRELVRDIRVAYYRVQQARRAVGIREAALDRVTESLRAARRLRAADRVTPDAVARARAERFAAVQEADGARAEYARARRAVNFLVNRPLSAPLDTASAADLAGDPDALAAETLARLGGGAGDEGAPQPAGFRDGAPGLAADFSLGADRRPELAGLRAAAAAAEADRRRAQSAYLPEVSLVVEGGIQGTDYGFTGDRPFALGSVVLRWTLFNGLADRARVDQARLATERLRLRRTDLARRIEQQVRGAVDNLQVARRSLQTARERLAAARENHRLTRRRAEVGRASPVALVDARSALTAAELNLSASRFELLRRVAELEFAAGFSRPSSP